MKIAISIAETSGDIIGARLIATIKKQYPDAEIFGLMGEHSAGAGGVQIWDKNLVNVMGFVEVLKKLPQIYLLRRKMIKYFLSQDIDMFIGVDSPDFNFHIEQKLKQKGIKTVHFISPSIWAWREKRVEKIKKSTDIMLCLLPFEVEFYQKHKVDAHFVGHPLAQSLRPRQSYNKNNYIALMPGSRASEVEKILPTMVKTANNILRLDSSYTFHIPLASDISDSTLAFVKEWIKGTKITYSTGDAYEVIEQADLVVVASGTASLEVALIGTPQVVVYKMNALTYHFIKNKIKSKFVSLPNIILNKRVVIELLQDDYNQARLVNTMFQTLKNSDLQREHFSGLPQLLRADFDTEVLKIFKNT